MKVMAQRNLLSSRGREVASKAPHKSVVSGTETYDMQGVASGLRKFSAAGQLKQQGLERMSWVYGPGELPLQVPFEEDDDAISLDHIEGLAQGHYIQILIPDPWGNAYLANVDGLQAGTQRVKVLSAGPDGVIDTAPSAQKSRGDDVLIQLF